MKTQPFHIEVIREREEKKSESVCIDGRNGHRLFVTSRARLRHYESIFLPFEIVKDVGEIGFFFYQGKRHRTGTEELMAKTIRVREKYFSYT